MGIYYSPRIVTNGLVLCLDAANTKSYPGSGTTWSDLSGKNFNGTLTNGPLYTGGSNGYFTFDGVDDNVSIPIDSLFNTPSVTYEVWANLQSINDRHILYVNWSGNSLEVNSDRSVTMYNWSASGQLGATTNSGIFNWGTWTHFVGIYNDTAQTLYVYINGTLSASRPSTPSTAYSVGTHLISGTVFGGEVNGKISLVKHYNYALTEAEILQNFQALRGRYGL